MITGAQLDLFAAGVLPKQETRPSHVNEDALKAIALCYTGTELGNNSGIKFAMSVADAMIWCGSPISRGVLRGTEWAYFWTSAYNFISCHWGIDEPCLDLDRLVDDGSWDERIASLGVKKIDLADFPAVFEPLGVTIKNAPRFNVRTYIREVAA